MPLEHKSAKECQAELSAAVSKHKNGFKLRERIWIKVSTCLILTVCLHLFSGGSPA